MTWEINLTRKEARQKDQGRGLVVRKRHGHIDSCLIRIGNAHPFLRLHPLQKKKRERETSKRKEILSNHAATLHTAKDN